MKLGYNCLAVTAASQRMRCLPRRAAAWWSAVCFLVPFGAMVVSAPAQETTVPPAADANSVAIEHFEFRYGLQHPALPSLEELNRVGVRLTKEGTVWHPAPAKAGEVIMLGSIPEGSRFDGDALREIAQEVVRWYNLRGMFGVWVSFLDVEASSSGLTDNRPAADNRTARVVVWASQVAEVRTLARGNRFKTQFSVNNRKHRGIIAKSPLHPGKTPAEPGSLFRKDLLDAYLHGLSLHPGRLVEASIASAGEPGKVVLDFLVNESKPWQIFSQLNNFGTEQTGLWRGRLGYQDNQLTNHDDILNIDVISTPDFKTYGSFLSYRIPLWRPAKLLMRVYGSYGDFLANNDATLQGLRFAGKNWLGGLELTNRLSLRRGWQLESGLGANFTHYESQSILSGTLAGHGFSNFLIPFVSETLSRDAGSWAFDANLRYDTTVGSFANTDPATGISALGRILADSSWTSLRWNVGGFVYVESLFRGADRAPYLANQLSLRVKGRYLLKGSRLIPQEEEPIGGALSVRGYAESELSADNFATATFEYAFHVPRTLKPGEPATLFRSPFKWRPTKPQQNPDWDFIVRAFYDFGHRQVTPIQLGAAPTPGAAVALSDKTLNLSGTGAGIEFLLKQNFSLRCDVGMALTELRDDTQPQGKEIIVPAGQIHYYLTSSFSW
ncbi:MAG: ShlB/FhaC/HecB family hemolysin secretion/activation protein [bacterium]|nr:ShlB/FhaC/HecB family hemolysin secretion/activation protein [bacterium]